MPYAKLNRVHSTAEVATSLHEIAALLEFSRAPKFKVLAYRRAAEVVGTVRDIGPVVEQRRLRTLAGIGSTLERQIEELWNTGQSAYLNKLKNEQPEGATELIQLQGMTPRRLRALHEALGVHSVLELRAACQSGRVRGLPRFGKKTEARLLAACDGWLGRDEVAKAPLLLAQALVRGEGLAAELLQVVEPHLVGAARRGEETLRRLEWLVLGDVDRAMDHLASLRQVLRVDRAERVLYLSDRLEVELHVAEPSALGNGLILRTGNTSHVEALQARATSLGFALLGIPASEHLSLRTRAFASELALYQAVGCTWVPPELRTGDGELTQAATVGFGDLVADGDVQGMVHCHTNYSDGKHSILEMASAAQALGMKYITITDHSPSAHYAGGVTLERLKEQWDEIARARELVPIRIFRGTESDILADGSLDYPDSVLEQFDLVIASIHARYQMDRSAMTRRLERALALPIFKIWGHPLGRILNHREPVDCDVLHVLDVLSSARGAIELNADPHRLDLPPAWIPAARERGIPFVISVDAHSTRGFDVLRYGLTMARRGGLGRDAVLNTRSAEQFARMVRPV